MENVFVAEKISKRRLKKGREEFYVKWKGWSPKHSTWEPIENILDHNLIRLFEKEEQEQIASGAIRKRKNRRFHFPLNSNADKASFSNGTSRSEEVLPAKQSSLDQNKNPCPGDSEHSRYEEPSTSHKFDDTPMHTDLSSVELHALNPNDKVIKERLHKKQKITKTKPNFDGQTTLVAGITKRTPKRLSKSPWRQAIIPPCKPECHAHESDPVIGTDWTKQELVITDVTTNSQTITFIHCDSEDYIFNEK